MRFGIALETFTPPGMSPSASSIVEEAIQAETLGFNSVWVWDHVLLGSRKVFPVLDSLSVLAAVGAKTTRVKLGTGVLVMALRTPVVLAKTLSTIHFMTQGRLILGAGAGWYRREFDATGVSFENRGKVFEERFALVRRLLEETDVNYESDGIVLSHASMEPKPQPRIPMLSGGYSDSVIARAGRIADGWIGYYFRPSDFERSRDIALSSAEKAGRDSHSLHFVNIVPLAIEPNFDEGNEKIRDFTSAYMDLAKNTPCNVDSGVRGTVSDCIEQVRAYERAGVQDLIFIPSFYDRKYLETAGREILPKFTSR